MLVRQICSAAAPPQKAAIGIHPTNMINCTKLEPLHRTRSFPALVAQNFISVGPGIAGYGSISSHATLLCSALLCSATLCPATLCSAVATVCCCATRSISSWLLGDDITGADLLPDAGPDAPARVLTPSCFSSEAPAAGSFEAVCRGRWPAAWPSPRTQSSGCPRSRPRCA